MNDSLSRRRRRTKLIRTRVVGGAVALFVAVFGGITAQLAAGHDPALSKSTTSTTTTTSATTSAAQPSTTTTTTQQKQDNTLAPVTTKQS